MAKKHLKIWWLPERARLEKLYAGSSKEFISDFERAVSHYRSAGRQPHLSGDDAAILVEHAASLVLANCDQQFFSAGGLYFIGTHILSFFGISLPVVQVGGGLIVISTGWTLLKQGNDYDQKEVAQNVPPKDPYRDAFYPLTLPLTVGPGSISVAITLGANAPHHRGLYFWGILAAMVGCTLLAVSIFLCYGFADRLGKILGTTGMTVIMQLTSFLLVCIGVQILWNGASALLTSLPLNLR
jgi:multiple antibiotic resistance protein